MSIEETIRLVVREEIRAAVRELANAVQARPAALLDEPLTKAQAAAAAGASTSTINRWITAGDLPVMRKGKHVRIKRSDLEALLARQVVSGGEADADDLADRELARRGH